MRDLAVRICNVVPTPDYSRPMCNLNLYNKIDMTPNTENRSLITMKLVESTSTKEKKVDT
jgi:hypothetical protein